MKLFVIATLIAVGAAARLEHLEQQQLRQYLPPLQTGFGSHQRFGLNGGHGSFDSNTGALGVSGAGQNNFDSLNAFPGVTNAYLPPNYESPASSGSLAYSGSENDFDALNVAGQQYSNQAGNQGSNYYGAQSSFQPQPSAVNRQYLAPHSGQNIPQQPFDEKTGYFY